MDLLSLSVQQTKPLIHKGFCWENDTQYDYYIN